MVSGLINLLTIRRAENRRISLEDFGEHLHRLAEPLAGEAGVVDHQHVLPGGGAVEGVVG